MTICKYQLSITDEQDIMVPEGAELLTAQLQGGALCLWALVNPAAPKQRRIIEIIGTGNPAPAAERKYIATVQMAGGSLVWHVFEAATPGLPPHD